MSLPLTHRIEIDWFPSIYCTEGLLTHLKHGYYSDLSVFNSLMGFPDVCNNELAICLENKTNN